MERLACPPQSRLVFGKESAQLTSARKKFEDL